MSAESVQHTCEGPCGRTDLLWDDFYWMQNKSRATRDKLCKTCRSEYYRARYNDQRVKPILSDEEREAKQIQGHIDEMNEVIATKTLDEVSLKRACWTVLTLRQRLRDLIDLPVYNSQTSR